MMSPVPVYSPMDAPAMDTAAPPHRPSTLDNIFTDGKSSLDICTVKWDNADPVVQC